MSVGEDNQADHGNRVREAARLIEQELREVGSIGQYEFARRMQENHGISAAVYQVATRLLFPRLGVTRQGEMLIVPSYGTFPIGIDPTPYQQNVRGARHVPNRGFMATLRKIALGG